MCLQKLGLKTPGSPSGRYLKVDWEGQKWGLCERENPPSWVEQGVVGTQEGLIQTCCVTGLQGSRAVLTPSQPEVCPQPDLPHLEWIPQTGARAST